MLLNISRANDYRSWDPCTVELPFTLDLWGSHPCDDNDDHYTGEDYLTLESAMAEFNAVAAAMKASGQRALGVTLGFVKYMILTGPGFEVEFKNPTFVSTEASSPDADWAEEFAMQNGMAFGCDGYNDAMGY